MNENIQQKRTLGARLENRISRLISRSIYQSPSNDFTHKTCASLERSQSGNEICHSKSIRTLIAAATFLTLFLSGCGSSNGSAPIKESGSGSVSNLTQANTSACLTPSPLKGYDWEVFRATGLQDQYDMIELSEDCTFKAFQCGGEGIITSKLPADHTMQGIFRMTLFRNTNDRPTCPAPGNYSCAFEVMSFGDHRMVLDCQLTR